MQKDSITFFSGVDTVTGSNFLLESASGFKILIDCGLIQGGNVADAGNREAFTFDPKSIDVLLVTHAHLDHVGRIPKLVKDGFRGIIISTPQTRTLAELVLEDAVNILDMEARQNGLEPIYNRDDLNKVFPIWETAEYHEIRDIGRGIKTNFKDAGHILGSSMIEITVPNKDNQSDKVILFSGDLGNSPAPLLRDTEEPGNLDYLVIESTYGDRNHESKADRSEKFKSIILSTLERGGTLVIPSFSIDRTQILLYELNKMVENNIIPSVPVFVDSPMAIKATSIYSSNSELFNDKVQEEIRRGDNIFSFPHLKFSVSRNESQDIERMKGSKIILAGSGMSVGGRVINHEELYLPGSNNTILLVGYQASGSFGRQLAEGAKEVVIRGKKIRIKARIETLYGYSAHKDSDNLVDFISKINKEKLKKVFVVMGEPKSTMHLSQRIVEELGMKSVLPDPSVKYILD